jgi:hypothetical protein
MSGEAVDLPALVSAPTPPVGINDGMLTSPARCASPASSDDLAVQHRFPSRGLHVDDRRSAVTVMALPGSNLHFDVDREPPRAGQRQ